MSQLSKIVYFLGIEANITKYKPILQILYNKMQKINKTNFTLFIQIHEIHKKTYQKNSTKNI